MTSTARFVAFIAFTVLGLTATAGGANQDKERLIDYQTGTAFLPQTPSVTGGAAGAFSNPAAWSTSDHGETAFWWNDRSLRSGSLDNYGFSSGRNLGFAMQRSIGPGDIAGDTESLYDYQIGLSGGNRRSHFGLAYRWARGGNEVIDHERSIVAGMIERPRSWLSYGAAGVFSLETDARQGGADIGVRPLGKPWLTFFGDYTLSDDEQIDEGRWGAGFEVRPIHGIHLGMKFRDATGSDEFGYSLNLGVTFDDFGIHVMPSYDEDGKNRPAGGLLPTTYLVRLEPPHRGFPLHHTMRKLFHENHYVKMDLSDRRLTYRKARWFDDERVAWIDLARDLEEIRIDPAVRGVVLNLAGFRAGGTLVWELREKLGELKLAGKEVIIHIERVTMGGYGLASVADHISIDPHGQVLIPGLALHRTYMKGLLEKIGIGFQELRHFKYKTASETLSRTDMSDADREQIGRIVDVIYEVFREQITDGRGFNNASFDRMVEETPLLIAEEALDRDLVDRIGRWHDMEDWIREERDGASLGRHWRDPNRAIHYDEKWGRPPEIALVYALGICAMEEGIRGRATSKYLRDLADDDDVAAIVLRADSPGGDPLPSDLVADGMTRNKEKGRPVIVSQGSVAASGGYWISMPGTRILTSPLTVTGSIGVIGGWAWDDGLGEKTGFTASGVKRGSHSDLLTGVRYPLLGRIPERALSEDELAYTKKIILNLYEDFVGAVAESRGMEADEVGEIAQGRVWMGGDALDLGLVDGFGTLPDAILEARILAGINPEDEIILTEFPKRKAFEFPSVGRRLLGAGMIGRGLAGLFPMTPNVITDDPNSDYAITYIEELLKTPGAPKTLTPPEAIPEGWYITE